MYNEIACREFARSRMREAQQETRNARLLASIEEDSTEESGQRAANRPGINIRHFLQIFSLRSDLAGSE
jgi:hypothetical protein